MASTGKIFSDSSNIYQDQARLLFNYYEQAAELISEGKKTIDKMWKESGIDTIRSVEKKSEAFYRFIDKSNDFITTTYPQTFSKDIAGSKKTDIIYELSSYTSERYVKPTLSRFQSSR